MDGEIGRVVDAVDRLAPDDTWIVFTSDHGEMIGAHGINCKGAARLPGDGQHAPARAPPAAATPATPGGAGRRTRRHRVPTLASHIDVLPTLLDLAGLPVPPALEGASLAPILRGEPGATRTTRRSVFVEFHRYELPGEAAGASPPCGPSSRATTSWRCTCWTRTSCTTSADDPHECRTGSTTPPTRSVRDRLHDELLDWMYAVRDPFRGPAWERRPWREPQTRRLTWTGGWNGPRRGWADGYAPARLNYRSGLPLDPA